MIALVIGGLLVTGLVLACVLLLASLARDIVRDWPRGTERARQRRLHATARLTAEEARAIAADAIGDGLFADSLVAMADERDGALVWQVASMTIDMGVSVLIDDATGAVLDVDHWSGWPQR